MLHPAPAYSHANFPLFAANGPAGAAREGRTDERVIVVPGVQFPGWLVRAAVYHLRNPLNVEVALSNETV